MLFLPCYGHGCRNKSSSSCKENPKFRVMLRFLPFKLCRWLDNLTTRTVLKDICNTKPQEHPLRPGQRQELNPDFLLSISLPKHKPTFLLLILWLNQGSSFILDMRILKNPSWPTAWLYSFQNSLQNLRSQFSFMVTSYYFLFSSFSYSSVLLDF